MKLKKKLVSKKIKAHDVFKIISNNINVNISKIKINSKSKDFDGWDSMSHINIILDIEKLINIKIASSKALELTSVKKIIKFLKISS